MKRIAITDYSGSWFDADKAECYKEDSYHDGRNFISKATGSQWEHEAIYITKSGKFILNHWSNWQGSSETYEIVDRDYVARWFGKQGFKDEDLPEIFKEDISKLEIN